MNRKILIVGSGITGLTLAERFAAQGDNVQIVEKRNHIGGNCYDYINEDGILIHNYGPHIFHTDYEEVWKYLSQFTKWIPYEHKVLGFIDGKYIQIPFNINSIYSFFSNKEARRYEQKLVSTYGKNKKISILDLKKSNDQNIKFIANFVYKKIFLDYTVKQWGLKPNEIDHSVTARVPIVTSRDDRYFHDKYQGMPKDGYTKMFKRMIDNNNIKIQFNTDYKDINDELNYDLLFYSGPIDEFFDYKFGKLGYRCAEIEFQTLNEESYQPAAVVNYPDLKFPFTRITEFKKLTQQQGNKTTIGKEFPGEKGFMSWPISSKKNKKMFEKYLQEAQNLIKEDIYFVGRLAEFRYYDMDDAVKRSLELFNELNL